MPCLCGRPLHRQHGAAGCIEPPSPVPRQPESRKQAIRLNGDEETGKRLKAVLKSLTEVEAQQKRLAKLYTSGMLPESALSDESARLNGERQGLEQKREALESQQTETFDIRRLRRELPRVLQAIRVLVENAEPEKLELALRALQVQITATPQLVQIEGIVPLYAPAEEPTASEDLVTNLRTSASPFTHDQLPGVPFRIVAHMHR